MQGLESKIGTWVVKYRWLIIVMSLLLVFGAASGGRFLVFKADYRVFFSEDNPQLQAFDKLEKTYSRNDNVLFVLTPKDGNIFTRETLKAIEILTEKAWQIPYSIRVDSVTNFQHTRSEDDDLIVEDLVTDADKLSNAELLNIKNIAINEPLLKRRLVSETGHVTSVSATIQLPRIDETKEVPEVVEFSRKLADEMRILAPGIEVRLSGMVLMNNAFAESAQGDMANLVPLSFAVMFVMLLLLLRSF
ncbi:MAG: MMPL family transporter, partial [Gammaproteobacteria bacterium]|nr:MMPL family transporter [Gammaproteobacteria bacterium]